jgi:hypothetical protein
MSEGLTEEVLAEAAEEGLQKEETNEVAAPDVLSEDPKKEEIDYKAEFEKVQSALDREREQKRKFQSQADRLIQDNRQYREILNDKEAKLKELSAIEQDEYASTEDVRNAIREKIRVEEEVKNIKSKEAQTENEWNVRSVTGETLDNKEYVADLAEFAKTLGLAEQNVKNFKANPYASEPGSVKQLVKMYEVHQENQRLKSERESRSKEIDVQEKASKSQFLSGSDPYESNSSAARSSVNLFDPFNGLSVKETEELVERNLRLYKK